MKKYLPVLVAVIFALSSCKKQCESESYGNITFKNISQKRLKVKINNTIPKGCLSANAGYLEPGTECMAEVTANLQHDVIVYDSTTVYWQFKLSTGPCGDATYQIE